MATDNERRDPLGEWLQRYLNPDIKVKDYKKLAKDAISFLGIDYTVHDEDVSFKAVQLIETSDTNPTIDPEWQKIPQYVVDDKLNPKFYSRLFFSGIYKKRTYEDDPKTIQEIKYKGIWSNERFETHAKNYYKHYKDDQESIVLFESIRDQQDPRAKELMR